MFDRAIFIYSLLSALSIHNIASATNHQYLSGPCMNAVWQAGTGTTNDLGCTANEVTASVVGVQGPTQCNEGQVIEVNVTTSIYFRATRYDFAIYTTAEVGGDPVMGEQCALDVLGALDANATIDGGVITQHGDEDECYDVLGNGVTFEKRFQDNLRIPCLGNNETGKFV